MVEYVNKFTGEIKKRDFGSPIWAPVQDFEHYEPGTSMTVPDQVEPLSSVIKRCMRGELLNLPRSKVAIEDDLSDAELAMVDGTADLADSDALLSAAAAAAVAKGEGEARSAVGPSESVAQASDSTTTESKTQSPDSSESKE